MDSLLSVPQADSTNEGENNSGFAGHICVDNGAKPLSNGWPVDVTALDCTSLFVAGPCCMCLKKIISGPR